MEPDPELHSRIQRTLGDGFTVERELGGGGMARVFLATDRQLGRRVVVKTLDNGPAAGVSMERFRREIRVAASLQQANIVPVHSAGDIDGLPYYTMPYVEGESLRTCLTNRGKLESREAVDILRDVSRALAYAHQRGIVHRDIKPENILLSGNTAVVTDFGIAKAIEAAQARAHETLTQLGTLLGTPRYVSPEQAAGDADVDHRSDIYSLGVVAYEMLCGEPPFTGENARTLLAAHLGQVPVPLDVRRHGLPARLVARVMQCLEKDPARRPQQATDLFDVFDDTIRPAAAPAFPSVAVLPFANLSPDPADEYFADGITDDLIAQVAKIGGLRVIARTSVMRYQKSRVSARQAATELGVSSVVEGTVRRAGNRARIVAQLVDATSDAPVWSGTYDRNLDDVFSVQSEVATNIAQVLLATLTPGDHQRVTDRVTVDATTYDWYLRGRHLASKRTDESLRKAIEYFDRCIARAPGFAAAHGGLADAYIFAALGYSTIAASEAFDRARFAAERALTVDPSSPDALCALALCEMHHDWRNDVARELLERAIAGNANHAPSHQWLAWALFASGDYVGAARVQRHALTLDPLSVTLIAESGWPFSYAGLNEEAMERYQRALELDPSFALAHYNMAMTYHKMGRFDDAFPAYDRAMQGMGRAGFVLGWLGMAFAVTGRRADAERVLVEIEEQSRTDVRAWLPLALVADALGDTARSLQALERAVEKRAPFVGGIALAGWLPLPNVRPTAEFRAIMDRVGVSPHDVARQRELLLAFEREVTNAPAVS